MTIKTKKANFDRCKHCGTGIFWRRTKDKSGISKIKAIEDATSRAHRCRQFSSNSKKKPRELKAKAQEQQEFKDNRLQLPDIAGNQEQQLCMECGGTVVGGVCLNCGSVAKESKKLFVEFN